MSAMKNMRTVALWEFKRFFKWKQEIISLAIFLVTFLVVSFWGTINAVLDHAKQVAVVSDSGETVALGELQGFELRQGGRVELAKWQQGELSDDLDAVVIIHEDLSATLISAKEKSWMADLKAAVSGYIRQQKLEQLPLSAEQIAALDAKPVINTRWLDAGENDNSRGLAGAVGFIILGAVVMSLMAGFGLMMMSITAEKQQRVTEQLLTLMTPQTWMDGKILGITLHGIKAICTMGAFVGLIIVGVAVIGGEGFPELSINLWLIVNVIVFLLLGLLLNNAMLAGFSATIDDPNHSSRASIMMLPVLPVGLCFTLVETPDSVLAQIMSLLPISSFAMMPIRLVSGDVPWWQWALSLALLVGFLVAVRNAAGRLFAMGINMYGKEPKWGDIGRAILGKNQS